MGLVQDKLGIWTIKNCQYKPMCLQIQIHKNKYRNLFAHSKFCCDGLGPWQATPLNHRNANTVKLSFLQIQIHKNKYTSSCHWSSIRQARPLKQGLGDENFHSWPSKHLNTITTDTRWWWKWKYFCRCLNHFEMQLPWMPWFRKTQKYYLIDYFIFDLSNVHPHCLLISC